MKLPIHASFTSLQELRELVGSSVVSSVELHMTPEQKEVYGDLLQKRMENEQMYYQGMKVIVDV